MIVYYSFKFTADAWIARV